MSKPFTFELSLSILNHLGRNLYRSFATVLGEAISNSWDADAQNVWIYFDQDRKTFWIKDDGEGMNARDFQEKFLTIGYSKRKLGDTQTKAGRPFIGRKGIGKLALLSCAGKVSVASRKKGQSYVGGTIENAGLDRAITMDLKPQQYPLRGLDMNVFRRFTRGHRHGTIIRFDGLHDGVRHTFTFLSKLLALYFRFSLVDKSFNIFLNDKTITHNNLADLASKTEFLWELGTADDPYVRALKTRFSKEPKQHEKKVVSVEGVHGFLASVDKPRDLKILTTDERVGVDLFVNGRLRERDILKHIPTARIVESYLYGQVHFDGLDDESDRFTSSREGVVAEDPKYARFLERFRKSLLKVVEDWDRWRLKHRKEGDPDNKRLPKGRRASLGLFNVVAKDFEAGKANDKVDRWVSGLATDASYNFESYAECFVSENLIRNLVVDKGISLSPEAQVQVAEYRKREKEAKDFGNISIDIRRDKKDLSYLDMKGLANLVDKKADRNKEACLPRDANEFKPIRDAVAHTALLTDEAKAKLTSVRKNIKARVKTLIGK